MTVVLLVRAPGSRGVPWGTKYSSSTRLLSSLAPTLQYRRRSLESYYKPYHVGRVLHTLKNPHQTVVVKQAGVLRTNITSPGPGRPRSLELQSCSRRERSARSGDIRGERSLSACRYHVQLVC
ncbi:hypothetical protein ElyMa_006950100 [Elysia marginata]|uniref:Uncharacterized protein n=1 Tax=Elysia marginata TaxID=1093978 RepID=A0AAV4JP86_9GAST|nr:hypothetical protein ElyMa_006950100 [Elysia marginata]